MKPELQLSLSDDNDNGDELSSPINFDDKNKDITSESLKSVCYHYCIPSTQYYL